MILDYLVEFCADTAVPTATGNAQVGDSIDLSAGDPTQTVTRIGADASKQMFVVITVTEAFTSGGAATVQFGVYTDAQDPITPASATVNVLGGTFAVADLTAGTRIVLALSSVQGERYLGLGADVGTAALTAGKVTAGLTYDPVGTYTYPDAVN